MAEIIVRIDSFEGTSNQDKVLLIISGNSLSGAWRVEENEIEGFPQSGDYLTSLSGILLSSESETIADLLGLSPGNTRAGTSGDVLIKSGKIEGGTAAWHLE